MNKCLSLSYRRFAAICFYELTIASAHPTPHIAPDVSLTSFAVGDNHIFTILPTSRLPKFCESVSACVYKTCRGASFGISGVAFRWTHEGTLIFRPRSLLNPRTFLSWVRVPSLGLASARSSFPRRCFFSRTVIIVAGMNSSSRGLDSS